MGDKYYGHTICSLDKKIEPSARVASEQSPYAKPVNAIDDFNSSIPASSEEHNPKNEENLNGETEQPDIRFALSDEEKEQYQYLIAITKDKTQHASNTPVIHLFGNRLLRSTRAPYKNSIPASSEEYNPKNEENLNGETEQPNFRFALGDEGSDNRGLTYDSARRHDRENEKKIKSREKRLADKFLQTNKSRYTLGHRLFSTSLQQKGKIVCCIWTKKEAKR